MGMFCTDIVVSLYPYLLSTDAPGTFGGESAQLWRGVLGVGGLVRWVFVLSRGPYPGSVPRPSSLPNITSVCALTHYSQASFTTSRWGGGAVCVCVCVYVCVCVCVYNGRCCS